MTFLMERRLSYAPFWDLSNDVANMFRNGRYACELANPIFFVPSGYDVILWQDYEHDEKTLRFTNLLSILVAEAMLGTVNDNSYIQNLCVWFCKSGWACTHVTRRYRVIRGTYMNFLWVALSPLDQDSNNAVERFINTAGDWKACARQAQPEVP